MLYGTRRIAKLAPGPTLCRAERHFLLPVDGNKDEDDTRRTPSASPPPPAPSKERAKTLELNKGKNAVALLQAEKELLMKQLEKLEKQKKRKESVAAEPAPPAKRERSCFSKEARGIIRPLLFIP